MHVMRPPQLVGVDLAQPEMAHLSGRDQARHRLDGLGQVDIPRRPVQVVQVDMVDSQAQQRGVTAAAHVVRLAPYPAAMVAGGAVDPELHGHDDLVAPSGDRAAEQHLVMAGAVDVGRVQQCDTEIQRSMDGRGSPVPIGRTVVLAHAHAAQPLGGYHERSECDVVHRSSFTLRNVKYLEVAQAASRSTPRRCCRSHRNDHTPLAGEINAYPGGMMYRLLADVTAGVHFLFVAYVVVGGFIAWRWRWTIWTHLAAFGWGFSTIIFGLSCPLTHLEN